ncbi:TorF family putative porin [Caenibius sp. WL]|uniref:TorF family putative porin n=1 Tax=Caenibius sp. WL TaxID=2872646 RepID=UPI001C99F96F|nr:TorF family putative porin [Caenibius sp. WL]QZP08034.1 TorF family putative porin [Caenibius sp. WL]
MLTFLRNLSVASALAGAAFVATPAMAQDEGAVTGPSDFTVSGNVAIVTDYRFRGVSLSGGDFAIQGGIDVAHSSGFYVGTWASSLDDGGSGLGDMELDVYGGWSGDIASNLKLDAGLLYYIYPAKDQGFGKSDYFEPYVKLSSQFGPLGATLGVAYAWDQKALGSEDNLYIFTDLEVGIPRTPITLTGHLGYTDGALAPDYLGGFNNDKTALDWSIGASATVLGGLTVGVSYVGVEGKSIKNATNDAVVGTLSYSF